MRARTRARLAWFIVGLVAGWIGSTLQAALSLWPFEENAFLVWVRWAGKSSIKYSFIALIVAVVIFVVVQLFNYFYVTREFQQNDK
jgi:hypothetical protein